MKKIFSIVVAFFAVMAASAQNIAVVDANNSTTIYQTLDEAITNATDGSTVYLPSGGFTVGSSTVIDKKLTIIGLGHRSDLDDKQGNTTIGGSLTFGEGSDGSAIISAYISNNVIIQANNILVKYCNLNSIQVTDDKRSGIIINQDYIRSMSCCGGSSVTFSNCVCQVITDMNSGIIQNCVIYGYYYSYTARRSIENVNKSTISYNFVSEAISGSDDLLTENYTVDFNNTFVKNSGITPESDFHLQDGQDYSNVGIYGGGGFKEDALAPIPRIISKKVSEQTDASGKLKIEVVVKAN